ncbi:MAG: FAD-binding protein [Planctomycetales bacterium]
MAIHQARSVDDVCRFVKDTERVRVVAGGSKPALSANATLSMSGLSGVTQYDPDEYTFTAWAGTPVSEINGVLAGHQQNLPFDPPFASAGATLGGSVAAGLSGPGRFRFGGIRDFIIAATMVNGKGEVVCGGAKVVKNAAGFDLPKLMVGSLGRYGVLLDLTFKVFPAPDASASLVVQFDDEIAAVSTMKKLSAAPLDLHCLDFTPPAELSIRVSGLANALHARLRRIEESLVGARGVKWIDDDTNLWQSVGDFQWLPAEQGFAKVPIVPDQIQPIEKMLQNIDIPRRYSVGGNVMWVGFGEAFGLDQLLKGLEQLKCRALVIRGSTDNCLPGVEANGFDARLRSVFDPENKMQGPWQLNPTKTNAT